MMHRHAHINKRAAQVALTAGLFLLAACGGVQQSAFVDNSQVDLSEPGLFSGQDGVVDVLAGRNKSASAGQVAGLDGTTREERILLPDGRVKLRRITVTEEIIEAK